LILRLDSRQHLRATKKHGAARKYITALLHVVLVHPVSSRVALCNRRAKGKLAQSGNVTKNGN
jgi:hypothetical protein